MVLLNSVVVDVVAVVRRKIDEFNAKAKLKFVVTDNARRADLMAVGESKSHRYPRSRNGWNIAFNEYTGGSEVDNSTIAAASIQFATSPEPILTFAPVSCSGTCTHSTHRGFSLRNAQSGVHLK